MPDKLKQLEVERSAFSITEFCSRNKISTPTYYELRKLGLAPKEMRLGGAIRISARAEREWQAARENPTGSEAEDVARQADRMRAKALRAVSRTGHVAAARAGA